MAGATLRTASVNSSTFHGACHPKEGRRQFAPERGGKCLTPYATMNSVTKLIVRWWVLLHGLLGCSPSPTTVHVAKSPLAAWAIEVTADGVVHTLGPYGLSAAEPGGEWSFVPCQLTGGHELAVTNSGVFLWGDDKELCVLDGASGDLREVSIELDHVRGLHDGKRILIWGSKEDECASFPGGIGMVQSSADGVHWRTDVIENDGEVRQLSVDEAGHVWFLTSTKSLYRSELLPDGGVDVPKRMGSLLGLARCEIEEDIVLATPAPRSVWLSGWTHYAGNTISQSYDGGECWTASSVLPRPIAAHYWRGSRRVFIYPADRGCTVSIWRDGDTASLASLETPYVDAVAHEDQLYVLTEHSILDGTQVSRIDLRTGEVRPFP